MLRACLLFTFFFVISCSHAPPRRTLDAQELLAHVCSVGRETKSVKGTVWMKVKSKEASGQFPAAIDAEAPGTLRLEVTNLVGGTEAIITIRDQKYQIEVPDKAKRTASGYGSWAGIPLTWATDLFLGYIPCPIGTGSKVKKLSVNGDGMLVAETNASISGAEEVFTYTFGEAEEKPWPKALHWERKGNFGAIVEFQFEDPDKKSLSPQKWEARSSFGQVKIKWRDRQPVM